MFPIFAIAFSLFQLVGKGRVITEVERVSAESNH